MADAMTSTASLSYDQTMWNLGAYYALRPQLHYDPFADVETTNNVPEKGSAVTFIIVSDLAEVTSAISETVDIDAVAMADTSVTYTLAEYANSVNSTFRVRATAFQALEPKIANVVGFNAGKSLDGIARNIFQAGTTVSYATGGATTPTSRTTVQVEDVLSADDVRIAHVELEDANVEDFNGMYASMIHPRVAHDLRIETGANGWRDPHIYSQPEQIWNHELGAFEGFRFVVTNRAPLFANASDGAGIAGTIDVYGTLFFGRQAFAKGYSSAEGRGAFPRIIVGPVTDKLERFRPVSWHWYGVFGVFRQAALRRVESASSIGANT